MRMKANPYSYILTLHSSGERRTNVNANIVPFLEKGDFEIYPAIDAKTNELELFCEKHPGVKRYSLLILETKISVREWR